MIPLGILTKHKPGGLPRTGPTRSPTKSGSSSYHSPTCLSSVCNAVHDRQSRSSPIDLHRSWLQNLLFGRDLARAAMIVVDFQLGDTEIVGRLGCSGAPIALFGDCCTVATSCGTAIECQHSMLATILSAKI